MNSHNPPGGVNESMKGWTKRIDPDEYDIATGRRCPKCRKLFPGIKSPEGKRCRHKQKAK